MNFPCSGSHFSNSRASWTSPGFFDIWRTWQWHERIKVSRTDPNSCGWDAVRWYWRDRLRGVVGPPSCNRTADAAPWRCPTRSDRWNCLLRTLRSRPDASESRRFRRSRWPFVENKMRKQNYYFWVNEFNVIQFNPIIWKQQKAAVLTKNDSNVSKWNSFFIVYLNEKKNEELFK